MADDLRLYLFECGSLKTELQYIKMNQGLGDPTRSRCPSSSSSIPRATCSTTAATRYDVERLDGDGDGCPDRFGQRGEQSWGRDEDRQSRGWRSSATLSSPSPSVMAGVRR